jgi:tetratricopeptide (TPR) repeat protein
MKVEVERKYCHMGMTTRKPLGQLDFSIKKCFCACAAGIIVALIWTAACLGQTRQQQHFSAEFLTYLREIREVYLDPAGLDLEYLEMRRPPLLAVICGDAFAQQDSYAAQNPGLQRPLLFLYKEMMGYLEDVGERTAWQSPDGTAIGPGLQDIAATSMDGKYGDSVWKDLKIAPRRMRLILTERSYAGRMDNEREEAFAPAAGGLQDERRESGKIAGLGREQTGAVLPMGNDINLLNIPADPGSVSNTELSRMKSKDSTRNKTLALEWAYKGACIRQKDPNKGLEYYSRAVELDPDNPDHYKNRGYIYGHDFKRYDLAIKDYTTAINLCPNGIGAPYIYSSRAFAYEEIGDLQRAMQDYGIACEKKKSEKTFECERFRVLRRKLTGGR